MDLQEMILSRDASGIGDILDSRLKSKRKKLPGYYKNKYGYGFHTSVALLRTGTMPGYDKQIIKEIAFEVSESLGFKCGLSYISGQVSKRISKEFGINFGAIPYVRKNNAAKKPHQILSKRKTEYESKSSKYGVCMECYNRFEIDLVNHPTNLCVCTKCSPNGINY